VDNLHTEEKLMKSVGNLGRTKPNPADQVIQGGTQERKARNLLLLKR